MSEQCSDCPSAVKPQYELLEMTLHMQCTLITMGFKEGGRENGGILLDARIRLGKELPG